MQRTVTRIAIATVTRDRPRMLADLIQSLQALDVPQGAELCFIFVENASVLSIAPLVEDFQKRTGWPARAILEPQRGASFAHNTALDAARQDGADWLAFVGDAEQVRHDWLRYLWAGAREADAQLAGGPVQPIAPKSGCSDDETKVLTYYERNATARGARKAAVAQAGGSFDIATTNWIADLVALERHALRFAGADVDLSRRAHKAGLTLAWVPGAVVVREIPADRLTASHIAEHARAQSLAQYHKQYAASPLWARLQAGVQIVAKALSGALCIALWPAAGSYSYLRGMRALGSVQGYWAGLRGQGRAHYTRVTGD